MRLATLVLTICVCFEPVAAQDAAEGEVLFRTFCSTCHGPDAQGMGPMAEILAVNTPDLTGLASGNEGLFPTARVARQIDGRDPMLAHGGQMPLFGRFFEGEPVAVSTPAGQPVLTSRPIADLIAYLQAVQN